MTIRRDLMRRLYAAGLGGILADDMVRFLNPNEIKFLLQLSIP